MGRLCVESVWNEGVLTAQSHGVGARCRVAGRALECAAGRTTACGSLLTQYHADKNYDGRIGTIIRNRGAQISRHRCRDGTASLLLFAASSAVVILGVLLGLQSRRPVDSPVSVAAAPLEAWLGHDGVNYESIAADGYRYNPAVRSTVAFFPAYPLAGRLTAIMSGLPFRSALVVVSNLALAATFLVVHWYARERHPPTATYAVVCFAVFPPTMFFHMAYSESLFTLLTAIALLGVHRGWAPAVVALVVGAATGTRPVGVALIPVVALYLWRHAPTVRAFLTHSSYVLPLSSSGLLLYAAYQWYAFGDPFAFARAQDHWRSQSPAPPAVRALSLLTLEPIWGAYAPSSPRYWVRFDRIQEPVYSLIFLNPLIFSAAAATVVVGVISRRLNAYEAMTAAGLLLLPYVTRAYENSMFSMARFAAAALPCYLVWGRALASCPPPIIAGLVAVGGYFLGVFAAQFAAGEMYF